MCLLFLFLFGVSLQCLWCVVCCRLLVRVGLCRSLLIVGVRCSLHVCCGLSFVAFFFMLVVVCFCFLTCRLLVVVCHRLGCLLSLVVLFAFGDVVAICWLCVFSDMRCLFVNACCVLRVVC